MKRINYLILLIFTLCFCASSVVAQGSNSITGMIFGEGNEPVSDVYVELLNQYGSTLTRTKTTGAGHYSFRRIPQGNYKVKVLTYGTNYLESVKHVSLVSISAIPNSGGISQQVDFQLILNRRNAGPLAAPGVIFAQDIPNKAENLYEDALELLNDNKDSEAFSKLISAIELFPDYYLALDRLGTEYVVRKYNRPAYVLLQKALEINPKSFSSTYGLGITQYRLGLVKESLKTLEKASELYGNSYGPHLWMGIIYHKKGDLKRAEASLNKANKLSNKKASDVHFQLARLYSTQKNYEEAARALELYLKHSKDVSNRDEITKMIADLRQKDKS